jgi:glycosyltransferase involved in cell wall biosynthesis
MRSARPAVSVVLPTFNRIEFLPRAVDSVLRQRHSDFELIVVDDGSTDATAEWLATLTDPRLRVVRLERNRGATFARNRGIEAARGAIVSFIDSDDRFFPHKLESVSKTFREQPALDLLVDSFVSCTDSTGRPTNTPKSNPAGLTGAAFRAALFERRIRKATSALSARRRALFDVGLFDEGLLRRQDFDLVLKLSKEHVCVSTHEILWCKYESEDAISNQAELFLEASLTIYARHPDSLEQHAGSIYHDVGSHFRKLLKRGRWTTFWADAARYRAHPSFQPGLTRLLLRAHASRSRQKDSTQRARNTSGMPFMQTEKV